MMTERFNVGGALLLKLFGRRDEEDEKYAEKAGVVRDLGIRISLITRIFMAMMMLIPALATALVYGIGGALAVSGALTIGTLTALATLLLRLLGPDAGPLQRARRRDDRPGQLRPRLRGARPALDRRGEARRGGPRARGVEGRVRPRAVHLPARRRGLARVTRDRGARREARQRPGAARHHLHRRAGPDDRAGRSLGRRQDDHHPPRRPSLRRARGCRPGRRPGRPRPDPAVARGRRRLRHPGRAHVPRHHPREPPLRRARRDRRGDLGGARVGPDRRAGPLDARRAGHRRRRPRLPALRR